MCWCRILLFALVLFTALIFTGQTACCDDASRAIHQQWKIGIVVEAGAGRVEGINATLPVPMSWPEQQVKVVHQEVTPNVKRVSYKVLNRGAKEMSIHIPLLNGGQTAKALVTFDVVTQAVSEPTDTTRLKFAKRTDRTARSYLLDGAKIESKHPKIRSLADSIVNKDDDPWHQVHDLYQWVRTNIKYEEVDRSGMLYISKDAAKIRSAVELLGSGSGDCDEMTFLFVALCRAKGIPARSVWCVGHAYPEFYLLGADGKGRWFTGDIASGNDDFGRMPRPRPIMQKGNRVVRKNANSLPYLIPTLAARNAVANPKVQWVMERIADSPQN